MRLAIIAIALLAALCGCAATQAVNTRGETVTTRSPVYSAAYAAKAGLTNEQTAACESDGRAVGWDWAGKVGAGFDTTRAGNAFEACVRGAPAAPGP